MYGLAVNLIMSVSGHPLIINEIVGQAYDELASDYKNIVNNKGPLPNCQALYAWCKNQKLLAKKRRKFGGQQYR